jgi:upstream activation factor subunit UAF30
MAKTIKTSATTAPASSASSASASPAPAATAVAVAVAAAAPVAATPVKVVKPKAPKAPKETVAVSSASASTTAAADAAPADEAVVAPSTESLISSQFASISSKLQQVVAFAASLRSELRALERHAVKELRTAQKASAKKRRKVGNRAPSGFVKPTLISKELAEFLGKTDGAEMARTEVTREINAYIRNNSLQDKENGRRINPDTKLKSLLKLKKGEELTYFNLQRYMSPHFAAAVKAVAAAATATATA